MARGSLQSLAAFDKPLRNTYVSLMSIEGRYWHREHFIARLGERGVFRQNVAWPKYFRGAASTTMRISANGRNVIIINRMVIAGSNGNHLQTGASGGRSSEKCSVAARASVVTL